MPTSSNRRQQPSLTMSYSQTSIGSANGLPMSQSHMGSFNHSQSVASTPTPTPPTRGSQQSAMSYSFTNGVPHPSMSNGFSGYERSNGYGTMAPYQEEYKPQIYRVCLFSSPGRVPTVVLSVLLMDCRLWKIIQK
jgi:hypothetical protein